MKTNIDIRHFNEIIEKIKIISMYRNFRDF